MAWNALTSEQRSVALPLLREVIRKAKAVPSIDRTDVLNAAGVE
jgi:hypothetical protein